MVIAMTDDASILRVKVKNTIDVLSLYQKAFNIKGIVYTNSDPVIDYARQQNLTVLREYEINEYGVPLLRPLMEKQKQLFRSSFYGYIYSDILIDPSLFSHVRMMDRLHGRLGIPMLFASRVYAVPMEKISLNVSSVVRLTESLSSLPRGRLRIAGSADIFLYTNDFRFETFPDAVIGRIAIDNIIVAHAKKEKAIVVDITETGHHIHQGMDRYSKFKRLEADKGYNMYYLNQYKRFQAVLNNADVVYNSTFKRYLFK